MLVNFVNYVCSFVYHGECASNQLNELTNKVSSFSDLFANVGDSNVANGNRGCLWTFTNETNCEKTLSFLRESPPCGNTAICVGGLFALDAASMRNIDYLLIVDTSSSVKSFWEQMKPLIKQSCSREDLKKKMVEEIRFEKNSIIDFNEKTLIQEIENQGEISFFSSEERYNKIRDIFQKDHFAFIPLDLCNSDISCFNSIGSQLKLANCKIDMIYTSNIEAIVPIKNFSERISTLFKSHLPVEEKGSLHSYIYIDATNWDYETYPAIPPIQSSQIKSESSES